MNPNVVVVFCVPYKLNNPQLTVQYRWLYWLDMHADRFKK